MTHFNFVQPACDVSDWSCLRARDTGQHNSGAAVRTLSFSITFHCHTAKSVLVSDTMMAP